jgi:hypothetical protein
MVDNGSAKVDRRSAPFRYAMAKNAGGHDEHTDE